MGAEFLRSKENEGVEDCTAAVPSRSAEALSQLTVPACRLDIDHDGTQFLLVVKASMGLTPRHRRQNFAFTIAEAQLNK